MGDSEIICYVREDGKVILWEEDSPEAWWVLDPDIVMTDNDGSLDRKLLLMTGGMVMSETSTVTFIGEVTIEHDSDLSHEEVVRLAFETLGDEEETDILDVRVERDTDD